MNAKKKSISLPGEMLQMAEERAKGLSWTLSRYIQYLVRQDLQIKGPVVIQETQTTPERPPKPHKTPVSYRKSRLPRERTSSEIDAEGVALIKELTTELSKKKKRKDPPST